jgi:hypothetical protein
MRALRAAFEGDRGRVELKARDVVVSLIREQAQLAAEQSARTGERVLVASIG